MDSPRIHVEITLDTENQLHVETTVHSSVNQEAAYPMILGLLDLAKDGFIQEIRAGRMPT